MSVTESELLNILIAVELHDYGRRSKHRFEKLKFFVLASRQFNDATIGTTGFGNGDALRRDVANACLRERYQRSAFLLSDAHGKPKRRENATRNRQPSSIRFAAALLQNLGSRSSTIDNGQSSKYPATRFYTDY
ncbi:MAG: hypothetical protein AB1757_11955 [Acidobacteriota bacterium]